MSVFACVVVSCCKFFITVIYAQIIFLADFIFSFFNDFVAKKSDVRKRRFSYPRSRTKFKSESSRNLICKLPPKSAVITNCADHKSFFLNAYFAKAFFRQIINFKIFLPYKLFAFFLVKKLYPLFQSLLHKNFLSPAFQRRNSVFQTFNFSLQSYIFSLKCCKIGALSSTENIFFQLCTSFLLRTKTASATSQTLDKFLQKKIGLPPQNFLQIF